MVAVLHDLNQACRYASHTDRDARRAHRGRGRSAEIVTPDLVHARCSTCAARSSRTRSRGTLASSSPRPAAAYRPTEHTPGAGKA